MTYTKAFSFLRGLPFLAIMLACAGCTTMSFDKLKPWKDKSKVVESKAKTPVKMAAIWTYDATHEPGQPVIRGFGARIFFYDETNKAIPVEGQLIVYAYDDSTARTSDLQVPDRKFVFTPDQFSEHHSTNDLGDSYSVWCPFGESDGMAKEVSMVPVFTTTTGHVVMGQSSRNLLQGKKADGTTTSNRIEMRKRSIVPEVDQVAYTESTGGTAGPTKPVNTPQGDNPASAATPQPRLRSSTINVSPSLSRKMNALGPNAPILADPNSRLINPDNPQASTGSSLTIPPAEAERLRQLLQSQNPTLPQVPNQTMTPQSAANNGMSLMAQGQRAAMVSAPNPAYDASISGGVAMFPNSTYPTLPQPIGYPPNRFPPPSLPNAQLSNARAPSQPYPPGPPSYPAQGP